MIDRLGTDSCVTCASVSSGTTVPPLVVVAVAAAAATAALVLVAPVLGELEIVAGVALKYRSESAAGSDWYFGASSSSTLYSLTVP